MKKLNETKTISELLNNFTFGCESSKGKSLSGTIKNSVLFSFWEEIIGSNFAKYTKPTKISNSKLYVSAKSPIIVQELSLNKSTLFKKINKYSTALKFKINDIVFEYKNYKKETRINNQEENKQGPKRKGLFGWLFGK